jgi:hypothetical protein
MNDPAIRLSGNGEYADPDEAPRVVLRLRNMPATPGNLERIRNRVHQLNRQLADSEAPFRLRLM